MTGARARDHLLEGTQAKACAYRSEGAKLKPAPAGIAGTRGSAGIMRALSPSYRVVAVLVALTYFGFRTELFRQEFEEFHPAQSSVPGFTTLSLNWETFDKDNAPKAFVFNAVSPTLLLGVCPQPVRTILVDPSPLNPVRDKSPPISFQSA